MDSSRFELISPTDVLKCGPARQRWTNPIYLDVDGNNQYSSPRDTAAHLIAEHELADRNLSDDQQQALFAAGKINADQAVQLHLKDLLTAGKDTK